MNKTLITFIMLCMSLGTVAAERKGLRVLEDGRELSGEALRLPSSTNGVLEIKSCETCPQRSLTLTDKSTFTIGGRPVGLDELRAHLNANPKVFVLVVTPINTRVVSRIAASAKAWN